MAKSTGSKDSEESSPTAMLGDFSLRLERFPRLKERLDTLRQKKLTERQRMEQTHALLLQLIQETETPCFLLGAVNEFISQVRESGWIEGYALSKFELWLNLFSGLDEKENYLIRAKIVGKHLPREAYQSLFPVGMGKKYRGSHYVTAHNPPDIDTTVASFIGWIDAFAARVGEGLHIWNVPGGAIQSQVEVGLLFYDILGLGCFDSFSKTRTSLGLSAADLVSRQGVIQKTVDDSIQQVDHEKHQKAVILVDEEGYYLADWRHLDVEGVRKVITLLSSCMRWFAADFQRQLTALFSKPRVTREIITAWTEEIFSLRFEEAEPVSGFTEKQRKNLDACFIKVLGVSKGLKSTFLEFWQTMEKIPLFDFALFRQTIESLASSALFTAQGELLENRPEIFCHLEKITTSLEHATQSLRQYIDRLGIALAMKEEVFGYPPQTVSSQTGVEEIRSKMGNFSHITVTASDEGGRQMPLGVIRSSEVFHSILGTVSLRDFCNREETLIPSYFEVISVIDHHKSSLTTAFSSVVSMGDTQSANSLVAEKAFDLNDQYSLSGCSKVEIEGQITQLQKELSTASEYRLLKRLLQKKMVLEKSKDYFVDPRRECLEYLQCLYAILDDTDLLSKISYRDIHCVAALLNRLKTLQNGKESEVIHFDDIPQDQNFVSAATKKVLQNEEMYSLYKKIYLLKEQATETALRLCVKGEESSIFIDTKVQNGCARVGQVKLFSQNFPYYLDHSHKLKALWYRDSKAFYEERKDCDLHLFMVSTVPGAEDVYSGKEAHYGHQDELWFWVPMEEQAIGHLTTFLNAFQSSPAIAGQTLEVEFLGDDMKQLERIFRENFKSIPKRETEKEKKTSVPVAVLRYKAGILNSRKAMISPYLPKFTS